MPMPGPVASRFFRTTGVDALIDGLASTRIPFGAAVIGFRQDLDQPTVRQVSNADSLARRLGWPDGFMDEWLESEACSPFPFFEACRERVAPFSWSSARVKDNPAAAHMVRFGLGAGITVPVRTMAGRIGCVSWIFQGDDSGLDYAASRHGAEMTLTAHLFIDRLLALVPGAHQVRLTHRERECLGWVANGKTDAEIGIILGRSAETARFHIKRATAKLGAVNRTQAVALAIEKGLLRSPSILRSD